MTNPFQHFNRRAFFKISLMTSFLLTPLARALAVAPISSSISGNPLSNSFMLSVKSTTKVRIYVEYGYSKSKLDAKTEIFTILKNSSLSVKINNLKANSYIYYRIRYAINSSNNFSSLDIRSVKTALDVPQESNTFAIQADPHMDENSSAEVYLGTLKQIVASAPAFLLDLGDIFMVDKLQDKSESNIRSRFELMKGFYSNLGSIPLKICLGNHDGELGYSKFNTKNYRKEYFPVQTSELSYYSFTGPNQLHVVLDPFTFTTKTPTAEGWEWTLGKVQYDWLSKTLGESKALHKFIYIHHLLVGDQTSRGGVEVAMFNEWGGKNKDGSEGFASNRPGWGKPIHELLKDNKVGFVFKGHDHLYVKQEFEGIIYQTLPQPSHPGEKLDVKQYGYLSGKGVGGSGFLKVTTQGSEAKVEFVLYDGRIADSYTRMA